MSFNVKTSIRYEYTHTKDRLWRKTRSRGRSGLSGLFGECVGVDMNRNFGYKWGSNDRPFHPRGGSKLSCLETFIGPSAWSEPEARALRDFIKSKEDDWVVSDE